jgi:PKD repeat protein
MRAKIKSYLDQFTLAPKSTVIGIGLVILTWLAAALVVAGLVIWSGEKSGQALVDPQGARLPTILLEPASGPSGSFVTIWGEDWPADDTVLIYLMTEGQTTIPDYAIANAVTDADGRFVTGVTLPSGPLWDNQETITIIARVDRSGPVAQAAFRITGGVAPLVDVPTTTGDQTDIPKVSPEPADIPSTTVEPTMVLTVPVPAATEEAEDTALPGATAKSTLTSIANLNVRSGPGLNYPVVGLLSVGHSAEITGVSVDGLWWQIYFPSAPGGRGWVSAYYVTVQNTAGVPLVQAPPAPAPTPVPPAKTWRGEYYANPILSYQPALVRNDPAIDFNWGTGSPASQLPAERFSVRWTRQQAFEEGWYRFYALVDDGVRLYVDDSLVIDEWLKGAQRQVTGERWLSAGNHSLRVEYYDDLYESVIRVWWEKVDGPAAFYPDWKGEYWPNRNLSGSPVIVRNDVAVDFNWGGGSPGAGLPADNFSARLTSDLYLTEGRYRFHLIADDGVRLWVNDHLFVDKWWDGRHEEWAEVWLGTGTHRVRLEYYEHAGDSYVHLWADRIYDSGGGYDDSPEADFDADRRSGIAPFEVHFDNDSDGDYDDCKWYFGDGDTSRDCDDPSHTYQEAGEYTVKLKVWNDDEEDTKKREDYITVYKPVEANFRASVTSGEAPLSVSFTNLSKGDFDQCMWSFGDGTISNDCDPAAYEYTEAGTYDVHLAVGGSGGRDVESKYGYIVVSESPINQPPTAVINGPAIGLVGDPLTFDGSSSSDPEGTTLSYAWNFGDGATGSGINVSHSYGQVGRYNIRLTVTDGEGLSDTSTYTVLIEETATDQSPVAAINGPTSAAVSETVIFDSDGSYDPDGTIVGYDWDFGDGGSSTSTVAQSAESTVAHVYDAPGSYQVTLTVTDDSDLEDTATHTIVVQELTSNQPPVAVINGPASGLVGEPVIFDSDGSQDPDGTIASYRWDFGDSGLSSLAQSVKSGESTLAHVYQAPGSYQVTLTVTDDDGASDKATYLIAIEGQVLDQPPQAVINGPITGTVGEILSFDGSSSGDPDGTIDGYAWDFDDGTTANLVKVSHSYSAPGNYNVSLTVTDDEGLTDRSIYTLLIEESSTQSGSNQSTETSKRVTATPVSPTPTSAPPTATSESGTAAPEPTATPTAEPSTPSESPTPTPKPTTPTPTPTSTPRPPTPTPRPATATSKPPTATAKPVPVTSEPAASTPAPTPVGSPSATPTIEQTEESSS